MDWTTKLSGLIFSNITCIACTRLDFLFRIAAGSRKLDAGYISIFGRWDEMPTTQAKTLFDDVWVNSLNVPKIREIIEALANTKRKVRYMELGYYLRVLHSFFLAEILKSYIAHQLLAESEMPAMLEELRCYSY